MPTTTTTTVDKAAVARWNRAVWNNAVWVNAVKHAEAVKETGKSTEGRSHRPPAAVSANIADIIGCIKAHESGDYNEHSHLQDGSGAEQYTPPTWAEWSVRAGYGTRDSHGNPLPTYRYAYLAPPAVQDDVTAYTLTHGGAHNWDPSYGNDPCTVNLP